MLAKSSGVQMRHVPYEGSAPALTDLLGGHISAMFVTPGAVMPYLRDKHALAVMGMPDVRARIEAQVMDPVVSTPSTGSRPPSGPRSCACRG
jgi:hypothetical protein